MDYPEICGKHKFDDARAWTKDAISQNSRDLILKLFSP